MNIGRRHENGQHEEPDARCMTVRREEQANRAYDFEGAADVNCRRGRPSLAISQAHIPCKEK